MILIAVVTIDIGLPGSDFNCPLDGAGMLAYQAPL